MNQINLSFITDEKLPLVIEPEDKNLSMQTFVEILKGQNKLFKQHLLKYGALLFRNFPIHNEVDFEQAVKNLNLGKFADYIGGDSPRKKIKGGIYTSTEAPPSIKIPLHNELSFTKNFPTHIYFYCDIAPIKNGETIIADARKVYQAIDEEVKNRLIEKQILYVSSYPYQSKIMNLVTKYHKSWVEVLETDSKQEVERKCKENEFAFKWLQNDWLQLSQLRPATCTHPLTHENVWFNQAHLFDFNPKFLGMLRYLGVKLMYCQKYKQLHRVYYGDHTTIPRSDLYHILDVLDANSIYFSWQKGDLLVLDNVLAMHGRASFQGKRRILAAMTK